MWAAMLLALDDAATLRRRARRCVLLAAALSAMTLSPLVVTLLGHRVGPTTFCGLRELSVFVGWGALLGALLATAAVWRAFRSAAAPTIGAVIRWSVLAGFVYPMLLFAPLYLGSFALARVRESPGMLVMAPLVFMLFGAMFSLPAGAMFGAVFWSGIYFVRDRLAHPAHDVVARAKAGGVVMLLAAMCLAVFLAGLIEGPYCQTLFFTVLPALDVVPAEGTDAAWTRYVVLPAPLLLEALMFALASVIEQRRIARTVRSVAGGTHPLWIAEGPIDVDTAARDGALPLREADRGAPRHLAVRSRSDGSPYRGGQPAVALIELN